MFLSRSEKKEDLLEEIELDTGRHATSLFFHEHLSSCLLDAVTMFVLPSLCQMLLACFPG